MVTVLLVFAFICLTTLLITLALILYVVFTLFFNGFDILQVPPPSLSKRKPQDSVDEITPDSADQTVPLDQFTPDPTKPVTIKYIDDDQGHGAEEIDELTIDQKSDLWNYGGIASET